MPRIKKAGPWNPQKAEAYVGKGVLKYGDTIPAIRGSFTPVPNGPLVKKNGSTLKKGGTVKKIKKAQNGIKSKIFVRDRSFGKPVVKESSDGNRKVVHQFKKNPFTGETRMVDKNIIRSSEAGPRKVFKRTTTFDPKQNFKSTESSVWKERGKVVKRETLKKGGTVVKVGGQTHKVFKNKKGDIIVDHTAGIPAGKWDKINLTKKAKAKTVKQGVASVKKWHKDNPNYYKKKK